LIRKLGLSRTGASGMSDPVNGHACEVDTSYCKFGCQTIVNLLAGFEENIDGVIRNEDVEYVHKARVISRRLRAALPVFQPCFPRKKYRRWTKEIKKATRLLGEARDLDVQIIFVQKYLKNLDPSQKKSLNVLLTDRINKRNIIQNRVIRGINKLKASKVLEKASSFCMEAVASQENTVFDSNPVLEKAQWHISFKLDDFLSLEQYVHTEDANQKHHEMRIKAKKLRYTMEFFAPLYKNKLQTEIDDVKSYQDILGEKHDFEVWINFLPKFIEDTKTKANQKKDANEFEKALDNFAAYIRYQRKERYERFVQLWEENQKQNFFDKLRETTKVESTMTEEKACQLLDKADVKVGLLSDVHANLQALQAVINHAEERGVDFFLNAGDSIGFGAYPDQVLELLCEKNVLSVIGNYDLEVLQSKPNAKGEKRAAFEFTKKELAKSCQRYLYSLPRELRLQAPGVKLLVTHGSPESIDEHIQNDTPIERLRKLAEAAKADVIIVGHSHKQLWRQVNGTSFINPGSVGRPSDGNPQAAYAILKLNPLNVELIRVDYNVEAAAEALRRKGLPEGLSQMLLRGVSLDTIVEEDKAREKAALQNCKVKVNASQKFAKSRVLDAEHYRQVTKLALEFFDGLAKLHGLGKLERCWLECASVMHDVGLSETATAHHKRSAKLILDAVELPLASLERRIVASTARYHRKGLPKQKHYNLKALDRKTVKTIMVLSCLLRVADALDCTHESNVKSVNLKVGNKKVTAECTCEAKSPLEEFAFNKKKDLFEEIFAKKLVLVWKQQSKPLRK